MVTATQRVPRRFAPLRLQPKRWLVGGLMAVVAFAGLLAVDAAVGRHQAYRLEQQRAAKAKLERMTMQYLRADVADVGFAPDGRYRVAIYLENVFPEYDLYVMIPPVRVFVQSGPQWKEVPTRDTLGSRTVPGTVVHLKGRITFERIFEIPPGDYFELLPGYFHVLFSNPMLVSPVAEPKDMIAERADNYYVHLLPITADVEDVRRRNKFPGDQVPIYIPMPPH